MLGACGSNNEQERSVSAKEINSNESVEMKSSTNYTAEEKQTEEKR